MAALCVLGSGKARAGDVSVTISGVIPNGTRVYIALCSGDLDPASCGRSDNRPATAGTVQAVFSSVAPGRYAIAAFQDLNGNGAMDRSPIGLPLEPYAFSNDAGRMRKPTFEAAAVTIGPEGRAFNLRLRGLKPTQ